MGCLVATLSVDSVESHDSWMKDVIAHSEDEVISSIDFPIIADTNRDISTAYGMIDPWNSDRQDLPLTIRCVFIINPDHKLMLSLNYPACVGRNMSEIVRCVQALQLSYQKSVATPANWPNNHENVTMADGTVSSDYKGSVFLLPTVSDDEAKKHYPDYHSCDVPSKVNYLRLVKPGAVSQLPKDNTLQNACCGMQPTGAACTMNDAPAILPARGKENVVCPRKQETAPPREKQAKKKSWRWSGNQEKTTKKKAPRARSKPSTEFHI